MNAGMAVLVLLAFVAPARAEDLVLRNVRLVDGTGAPARIGVSVHLRSGRIFAIGPDVDVPGAKELDAGGATAVPGLIDTHVHLTVVPGTVQRGDTRAEADALKRAHLRGYLASGVTTVLDTGIDPDDIEAVRGWLASGEPGPTFLTLGPGFITPGGYLTDLALGGGVASPKDVRELFALLDTLDVLGAKVMLEKGFGPVEVWPIHSEEVRAAIVAEAAARNLPIFTHGTHEDEQALGLDMGARALVHTSFFTTEPSAAFLDRLGAERPFIMTTFSIMDSELVRWEPERLDDPLVRRAVPAVELNTASDPEAAALLTRTRMSMLLPRWLRWASTPVAWIVESESQTRSMLGSSMSAARKMHEAGAGIIVGSDAGNWTVVPWQFHGPSTHREIELLVEAGWSPEEALAAATRLPAEMLGLEAEIGTLDVGKRADILLVRGDPLADPRALRNIVWVVKDGIVRTPADWMAE